MNWSFDSIVLLLSSISAFFLAFYFFYRKRIIEDIPTSKIRSAAQGYVELFGRGQPINGKSLIAPLSGTQCIWYKYEIEKRRGIFSKNWRTIERGASNDFFLLVDNTGQVVIDPEGASITHATFKFWKGNSAHPLDPAPKCKWLSFDTWLSLFGPPYRYTEERINTGKTLYAIGLFNTVDGEGEEFNINKEVQNLLMKWKKNSEFILKTFDKNKNGQIDMDEWNNVRQSALKKILAHHEEQKSTPPFHIMGKTYDKRRPYVISTKSQSYQLKQYTLYIIFAGITSLVTGFFAILVL